MPGYRGPPYSCPDFDTAIEHIEKARSINSELRDDNDNLTIELREAVKHKEELEDLISELRDKIEDLQSEIKELNTALVSA